MEVPPVHERTRGHAVLLSGHVRAGAIDRADAPEVAALRSGDVFAHPESVATAAEVSAAVASAFRAGVGSVFGVAGVQSVCADFRADLAEFDEMTQLNSGTDESDLDCDELVVHPPQEAVRQTIERSVRLLLAEDEKKDDEPEEAEEPEEVEEPEGTTATGNAADSNENSDQEDEDEDKDMESGEKKDDESKKKKAKSKRPRRGTGRGNQKTAVVRLRRAKRKDAVRMNRTRPQNEIRALDRAYVCGTGDAASRGTDSEGLPILPLLSALEKEVAQVLPFRRCFEFTKAKASSEVDKKLRKSSSSAQMARMNAERKQRGGVMNRVTPYLLRQWRQQQLRRLALSPQKQALFQCTDTEADKAVQSDDTRDIAIDQSIDDKDLVLHVDVYSLGTRCSTFDPSRVNEADIDLAASFLVLSSSPLYLLRDVIPCHHDDPAINPGANLRRSACFVIENTCYDDLRLKDVPQYRSFRLSDSFAEAKQMEQNDMSEVTFGQLSLCLGRHYAYLHQGDCQHVVVFRHVREHSKADPLKRTEFPHPVFLRRTKIEKCACCEVSPSDWAVYNDLLSETSPAFYCDKCLRRLHTKSVNEGDGTTRDVLNVVAGNEDLLIVPYKYS
ncbi:MAG: hypothetical protein MHM6MM_007149 [Cercozoa sp. M6MM]